MSKLFGEILIEEGKLTREQVEKGLELQKDNSNLRLGEILVTLNYIKYDDIIDTLMKQYNDIGELPEGVDEWLTQDEIDEILNNMKNEK